MKNNKGKAPHRKPLCMPSGRVTVAVLAVALAVLTYVLTAVDGAHLLRKTELLSYFAPTSMYLHDCLAVPGGVLVYASTFLTQSFYHPWLGGAVYALLLVAVALAGVRAFSLRGALLPLAFVAPALALTAWLDLGYVIFSLKSPGYAFNLPLGLLAAECALWLYRSLRPWWARLVAIVVIVGGGYCVAGFYALLAGAMCIAAEIPSLWRQGGRAVPAVLIMGAGALAIWAVPALWFACVGGDLIMTRVYLHPLPMLMPDEGALWWPYNLIILVEVLAALLGASVNARIERLWIWALGVVAAVAAMTSAVMLKADDPNLRLTLALDHAMHEGRWHEAIDIARKAQDIEPTRVNVALADLAMLRAGCLGDSLFRLRIASAPYETKRNIRATHDILSRMLAYHTGMANYAYRWGMEYKVEYGTSVEQLQFMAKAALLNGDYQLAKKALENLRLTACHRDWADRYMQMAEHPELIADDPELAAIRPLIVKKDGFLADQGRLEGYIWKHLACNANDNASSLELSLCSAMICQDMMAFATMLPHYAALVDRLPVHIQEGVLAWQTIDDNFDITPYRIDPQVQQRFEAFMKASQMYSQFGAERQKQMLGEAFGDTFWYYYLHTDNLTIF